MSRRRTKAELEQEVRDLRAYRDAFWALDKGQVPRKFTSGGTGVRVVALDAPHGGVVVEGPMATYVSEWVGRAQRSVDPYTRDLANQVHRASVEAMSARHGGAS